MKAFITLTYLGEKNKVIININYIYKVVKYGNNCSVHVVIGGKEYTFVVEESFDYISRELGIE